MNLVEHAKTELELCGQAAESPGYAASLVAAVAAFASYGHSGGSSEVAIEQLNTLLQFRTLSPLTSNINEWQDRTKESGAPMWQNKRDPAAFSTDAGQTWHFVDDRMEEPKKSSLHPKKSSLHRDLKDVLNKHSAENESNTPDYILADHLINCLEIFNEAVKDRAGWYGRMDAPGQASFAYTSIPAKEGDPTPGGGRDERPHSRACGIMIHPHGVQCSKDCPTCYS